MASDHHIIIITSVIFVLILLIYAGYMYYAYSNNYFPFDYQQPALDDGWQPFGTVKTLTDAEIQERQNLLGNGGGS